MGGVAVRALWARATRLQLVLRNVLVLLLVARASIGFRRSRCGARVMDEWVRARVMREIMKYFTVLKRTLSINRSR